MPAEDLQTEVGRLKTSLRHERFANGRQQGHQIVGGLGLFIAKSFLERSEARVTFANRVFPAHGAVVRVHWYRHDLESHHDLAGIIPATPDETAI